MKRDTSHPQSPISNPHSRLRVGVIFGGRSPEHEVSLVSAASIIGALDKTKYEVIPIGISPEGHWISSPDALELLKSGLQLSGKQMKILLPDPSEKGLVEYNLQFPNPQSAISTSRVVDRNPQSGVVNPQSLIPNPQTLDVIFPVLHGTFGEDGTIQGLFELAGIPYIGAGVLGSSVGMDKVVTKQLSEHARIPVTPYVWFTIDEYATAGRKMISQFEKKFRYPCFVKPANMGSSVGISKARNRKELLAAIELAAQYDRKILIEKSIERAREVEVSVLGNDDPIASVPGEIISSNEFYDYDAKYVDGKSTSVIPAKLPRAVAKQLQLLAVKTFKAVDCSGMGRVDFLVTKSGNRIFMNEINTIPGFTSISMYPKLWEATGLSYPKLLDRLIELAIERFTQRQRLNTVFKPKRDWYRRQ